MASQAREKKLTVGMATYDDYDGVFFTVQAIRLYHPEVAEEIDVLVVDNHPAGASAEPLQELGKEIPEYRYLATQDIRGTAVRDPVFREARTPYVLCVDSHVLVVPGALRKLVDFLDQRPDCRDLLQGPLLRSSLRPGATHCDPTWRNGMYGVWATDERGLDPEAEPFEIPMQGLGLFACRKDAWLGFNPRFAGFGGEEGYLHEKYRQAGRRTLCLPFLGWLHRFGRPHGVRYSLAWKDRVRNYLIGWEELGLDPDPVIAHFEEYLGPKSELVDDYVRDVRRELANPLSYFDAIYCINLDSASERWQEVQRRFEGLGIAHRVRRFPAVATPESRPVGCWLSHRTIVEHAERQGLGNVLVFEDDALFLEDTLDHLGRSVAELRAQDWNVFHLGGHTWGKSFPIASGCSHLRSPVAGLSHTHAVAYNRPVFRKLLDDIPGDVEGMCEWLQTHRAIDLYLGSVDKRFLCRPAVASQPSLLYQEDPEAQKRFTLGEDGWPAGTLPEVEGGGLLRGGGARRSAPEPPRADGVYRLSPGYVVTTLEDRVVVHSPVKDHTIDLNATAGLILGLMDGKRTLEKIRSVLQATYPEAVDEIARDVDRIVGGLLRYGAVRAA